LYDAVAAMPVVPADDLVSVAESGDQSDRPRRPPRTATMFTTEDVASAQSARHAEIRRPFVLERERQFQRRFRVRARLLVRSAPELHAEVRFEHPAASVSLGASRPRAVTSRIVDLLSRGDEHLAAQKTDRLPLFL